MGNIRRQKTGGSRMHEFGIAQNILDIVRQAVPPDSLPAVRRIRVRFGQLSGVVPDSLEFCFGALVNETDMKQAGLLMEESPVISRCLGCGHQFTVEDFAFSCPLCDSSDLELVSGNELEVVNIELAG
jgi:hydrogenase nickel incorporation protein HypA/HybF